MSSDGYLSDAATRHQVHVQRYAGGSLKRLAKFITKAISCLLYTSDAADE